MIICHLFLLVRNLKPSGGIKLTLFKIHNFKMKFSFILKRSNKKKTTHIKRILCQEINFLRQIQKDN